MSSFATSFILLHFNDVLHSELTMKATCVGSTIMGTSLSYCSRNTYFYNKKNEFSLLKSIKYTFRYKLTTFSDPITQIIQCLLWNINKNLDKSKISRRPILLSLGLLETNKINWGPILLSLGLLEILGQVYEVDIVVSIYMRKKVIIRTK